jgi:hypothetical protein
LKNFVQNAASELVQSAKIATGVSAATTTSGIATVLEWIPTDIGKLATLIGLILSTVLIFTHWKKSKRAGEIHDLEKRKLEIEIENLESENNRS